MRVGRLVNDQFGPYSIARKASARADPNKLRSMAARDDAANRDNRG